MNYSLICKGELRGRGANEHEQKRDAARTLAQADDGATGAR